MPELKSPVMDSIYTDDKRRNHPLPTVSVSDLQQSVKNIAITKRGGEPVPVYEDSMNITHIEPQPFRPSERLNGVDVNNLKLLDDSGVELLVNNKIDRLRRIVRASTEAMAAQSLKGAIAYPMAIEGGEGAKAKDEWIYNTAFRYLVRYRDKNYWLRTSDFHIYKPGDTAVIIRSANAMPLTPEEPSHTDVGDTLSENNDMIVPEHFFGGLI